MLNKTTIWTPPVINDDEYNLVIRQANAADVTRIPFMAQDVTGASGTLANYVGIDYLGTYYI
jgi:hypothetical protein